MSNYDKAYESYLKKCREFKIAPSSKQDMFGADIVRDKNENHISIGEISKAKKEKAPVLSETAKEALTVKKKPKRKPKVAAVKIVKVKKEVVAPKVKNLLSDEENKEYKREKTLLYYEKNKERDLERYKENMKKLEKRKIAREKKVEKRWY